MKARLLTILLAAVLLTGCSSFLEREYSVLEPHSSKFWESEVADTLRAENFQDVVNDLLLLIGQHKETATLHLYNFDGDLRVTEILERATVEVQQQTPMGAYAVEYITVSSQAQRGYYEVALQIGYRRTAEQIQAIVNATRAEAVHSLLSVALERESSELAVRIGHWTESSRQIVESIVAQLRDSRGIPEEDIWIVNYYPDTSVSSTVSVVEILMDPSQDLIDAVLSQRAQMEAEAQEAVGEEDPNAPDSGGEEGSDAQAPSDEEALAVLPETPAQTSEASADRPALVPLPLPAKIG